MNTKIIEAPAALSDAPDSNATVRNPDLPANETKRVICRCRVKGCKYVRSINVPTVAKRITTRWHTFLTREACPGTVSTIANDERCPSHPRFIMNVRVIVGKVSADHVCDSRCTSAIGHTCECQCGGANHGANWL
jgi:hypothetical protein